MWVLFYSDPFYSVTPFTLVPFGSDPYFPLLFCRYKIGECPEFSPNFPIKPDPAPFSICPHHVDQQYI